MTDVTRAEFDGSVRSLREEIRTMGENLNRQLAQISQQLADMSKSTSEDSKAVAVLKVRMDALEAWKANNSTITRSLIVGIIISFAAQIIQVMVRK